MEEWYERDLKRRRRERERNKQGERESKRERKSEKREKWKVRKRKKKREEGISSFIDLKNKRGGRKEGEREKVVEGGEREVENEN